VASQVEFGLYVAETFLGMNRKSFGQLIKGDALAQTLFEQNSLGSRQPP